MATIQQLQTSVDALTKAQADLAVRLESGIVPDAVVTQVQAVTAALNAEIPAPVVAPPAAPPTV